MPENVENNEHAEQAVSAEETELEALLTQPSSAEEGSVIEVLQKGYRLGDRVLRPARVVVAGPKEEGASGDSL